VPSFRISSCDRFRIPRYLGFARSQSSRSGVVCPHSSHFVVAVRAVASARLMVALYFVEKRSQVWRDGSVPKSCHATSMTREPGSLSVCRYDVACHRFFNKPLERSAAKNSARVTRSNNFGRGQSALENRKGHRTVALVCFGIVYPRLSSGFRLGSRRQKFVLLEKCDDRLAAERTERVCSPLKPSHDLFMPILNFSLKDIALIYEHRP